MTTHKDEGAVIGDVGLRCERGNYGGLKKDVRDKVVVLKAGGVVFECEEGAVGEHEVEGILELPKK